MVRDCRIPTTLRGTTSRPQLRSVRSAYARWHSIRVTTGGGMLLLLGCAVPLLLNAHFAFGQGTDQTTRSPLATKQQIIQDRVLRLEDQMYRLIQSLKTNEPAQAARLEKTLVRMGELGVRPRLEDLIQVLARDELDVAVRQQDELLGQLSALLALLIEEPSRIDEHREEIERLQEFMKDLDRLIAEESKLAQASQDAREAMQGYQTDAEAAAAMEELLRQQQTLRQHTEAKYQKPDGAATSDLLADQQRSLTKQAEQLAKLLKDKQETESGKSVDLAKLTMQDAVEELSEEAYGAAGDAQDEVIEELKRALAKLTKKPPDDEDQPDFESLSAAQEQTGDQAAALAEQMRENPSESQRPTPGLENVEVAKQQMDSAAGQLQEQNPTAAEQQQQQAIEQLEKAKSSVQERINQLKRELQDQKLEELKKKFSDMLVKQQAINRRTTELDGIPQTDWKRRQQLQAVEQGRQQNGLAELAAECLQVLRDDGTTVVLPQLVDLLREDMLAVAGRLTDLRCGSATQAIQREIIAALENILDAIEQGPQSAGQSGNQQQQQAQQGDPPLLPASAELKLLANLQESVFRRTRVLHRGGEQNAEQLGRLARRQSDVARMATEMSSRMERRQPQPKLPQEPPRNG